MRRNRIIEILVFFLAAAAAATLIRSSERWRFQLERARVAHIAGDYAHVLQANIERALSATYSLAAIVRQGKGTVNDFEATAAEMLRFYPGAASLQLAPGGVLRKIVPLAGNEGAIGHDLFKDPARRNEAIKTRDDGKLTLAGPFLLKQGGFGAVGRMPVYLDNGKRGRSFWGFTNVLIRFPQVLEPARLANLEQRGFRYELWRLHPDTGKRQIIAASSSAPLIKPVDRSFELPNGTWTLSVAPSAGWSNPGGLALKSGLGLAFSLLLFFLTHSLLGTRAKALQIAQELTSELRKSEEKFRAIFDHTFQFIGLMSVDGTLIEANRSALELGGIKGSEVIGKPFWETPWWTHSREMQDTLRAAIEKTAQGEFVRFEATHPAIDGSLYYVDFSLKPVMNEEGNIVLLIPEGRDITDRKRAEEEVRHLKNYLSNIINSMPSLLAGLDCEGRVTQWNRQAEAHTGIAAAEAVGRKFTELAPDFTPWIEQLHSEIEQRRPASLEKLLIEKEGERHFYDLMLYPLVGNGMEGTVVRIEDVTERARIQELMVQTEKMMSVGGLAAGMAHEINNPLGIIAQATQNIERRVKAELPANRQAAEESGISLEGLAAYFERRQIHLFIASIREAAARASRIITNILRFSRQAEAEMQPVPLANVMEQAVELAANDYDLKKKYDFRCIEIVRNYQPDLPEVPVVATEIEQVLLNLLKNAAQAMIANPPERKPCLVLRITKQERYAVLEVEDNGSGMTEDIRRRVFEPFFTTKEPGVGTGLGLSVSYMIVTQNHKGLMDVASLPGKGARFTVMLPLKQCV